MARNVTTGKKPSMKPFNWESLRIRFLRDPSAVQLGNMASDLGRISSACNDIRNEEMVQRELQEVRYFIEWTTAKENPHTPLALKTLDELVETWQQSWSDIWNDVDKRTAFAKDA